MNKKGFTLIELLVGMAVFLVVSTMIIGAFVTVVRLKSMASIMRESQQKLRTASEMVSRLSRQAQVAAVGDCVTPSRCQSLMLFYNTDTAAYNGVKFKVSPNGSSADLLYYECNSQANCLAGAWNPVAGSSLSSGTFKLNLVAATDSPNPSSYFHLDASTLPAKLTFVLAGKISGISSSPYYSDSFKLDNSVTMDNIVW